MVFPEVVHFVGSRELSLKLSENTVVLEGSGVKVAVSVMGPFIVTDVELLAPE
jgi:hypothetical protein